MALRLINGVLSPYNWAKDLISNFLGWSEKEALVKQVDQLKTMLQRAEEQNFARNEIVTALSIKLKSEQNEKEILLNQVEYLNNEFCTLSDCREANKEDLQDEINRAGEICNQRMLMNEQLEMANKQLDQQIRQEKLLVKKERKTQTELENLSDSYNCLYQAFDKLRYENHEIEQKYHNYIVAEKEMINDLKQQLGMQTKFHASALSQLKNEFDSLKCQKDSHCQKLEEEVKLMKQDASRREKSLVMKLLKMELQLSETLVENFELVDKMHAEEEVGKALHTEAVQLKKELKDKVCQQNKEFLGGSLDLDAVAELEFQLDEMTIENEELVAKFRDEEEVSQALRKEVVQLKKELNDKVRQQDTPAGSQDPKRVEEAGGWIPWKRLGHFLGLR